MRSRERHVEAETTTTVETRKLICRSVTTSAYFDEENEYPLDMDLIYDEVKEHAAREALATHPDLRYENVLRGYEQNELSDSMVYTYPITRIDAHLFGDEFAFACATKKRQNNSIQLYYISDAYNVNVTASDPDASAERPVLARFVFFAILNKFNLVAMAEEPATLLTAAEAVTERTYIRLRNSYFAAQTPAQDPLCRLSKSEKLRVCASVLASSRFILRNRYFPLESDQDAECMLNMVSFRTISGKEDAKDHFYKEWMLPCRATWKETGASIWYSVSQAYHPHHVFVYVAHIEGWKWKWYGKNISAGISVITDKGEVFTKEGAEHPLPNLVDVVQHFSGVVN